MSKKNAHNNPLKGNEEKEGLLWQEEITILKENMMEHPFVLVGGSHLAYLKTSGFGDAVWSTRGGYTGERGRGMCKETGQEAKAPEGACCGALCSFPVCLLFLSLLSCCLYLFI